MTREEIDCISREQVHDLMENELRCVQRGKYCDRDCAKCPLVKNDKELIEAYGYVIKALEQEPKEQEPKWIPVSERLPENDEDVLVCYPQGGMEVVYYHFDNSIYPTEYEDLNETGWCNEEGDALYFEPIAWMPLPEPYEP